MNIEEFTKVYNDFEERLYMASELIGKIWDHRHWHYDSFELFGEGTIELHLYAYCCGGSDFEHVTFPTAILYDSLEVQSAYFELGDAAGKWKREADKAEKEVQKAHQATLDEMSKHAEDYETYLKLKEQFGGGNK